MNEIINIENSLEASTVKDNLLDIIGGSADYSIEKFLDMGDGIPIVSYLTKGVKTTLAIRDYIFMEKVIEFLREVGKEPTSSRQKMIDKIQEDTEYSQKFGKVSLIAIDRFDDVAKATYLGRASKYLAREDITFSFYKRIIYIINRMHVDDILLFKLRGIVSEPHLRVELETMGLVRSKTVSPDTDYYKRNGLSIKNLRIETKYNISKTGEIFKAILLDEAIMFDLPSQRPWSDYSERLRPISRT